MAVQFGLVNVPVAVYNGTEESGVSRHEFTLDGHPVGRKLYDKVTDETIAYCDVVRAIETCNGTVTVDDAEIESLTVKTPGVMEVIAMVPLTKWRDGTFIGEKLYQLRPLPMRRGSRNIPDPGANKAFALLMGAMKAERVFALVRLAMRGVPRYAAILPNGRMHVLLFEDEIRADLPLPVAEVSEDEMAMGCQLVRSMKVASLPSIVDETSVQIMQYAEAKAAGTIPSVIVEKSYEGFGDLMVALENSLSAAPQKKAS